MKEDTATETVDRWANQKARPENLVATAATAPCPNLQCIIAVVGKAEVMLGQQVEEGAAVAGAARHQPRHYHHLLRRRRRRLL